MLESELKSSAILIVDDQVANICLMQNILGRIGYNRIDSTTDPREVFQKVESFKPDLIILDLNMPHIDGFEVMTQLGKVVPRDTFLPVLVLTGDASGQAKRKALAAGASDLLHKPFNSTEAFMRISNLLRIRHLHNQLQNHNQHLEEKVAERTRELQEIQRQVVAQERLRAFGEMAGGVVHDFNNALMSVIGYSEILLTDDAMASDVKMVREFLKVINTAGRDASHVVGRLREFYRPRELSDVFTSIDVNDVLELVVPLTQPKWKDQALADGRAITVDLDLEKLPPIAGDASELREALTNLIFNAVDAMPKGGTITLRSRREGDQVVLEISDTGTGMTDEVRTRCLEPFFSTKGEKGTGLGLSMVFGIIKRHEGTVEIESNLGRGTTFRIRMPSQVQQFDPAREQTAKLDRSLRVLVVDDEPVPRDVLQKYLTADGHSVVTAKSAYEAVDRMREEKFDLLLTDHGMPGMNGVQLVARAREIRADQPVILVTGFTDPQLTALTEAAGIPVVVRKPVPHSELRKAMAGLLAA